MIKRIILFGILISGIIITSLPFFSIKFREDDIGFTDKQLLDYQVIVENGCGVTNLANVYTKILKENGINVIDSRNSNSMNYTKSLLISYTNNLHLVRLLAKIVGISAENCMYIYNENKPADIVIIIGKDYDKRYGNEQN